jgi:hypothetical protein
MTWRRFFIRLLGGKCNHNGCDAIEDLEIDHIVPVENNAMSGAGRFKRLQDWREQFLKGNLQLLCKEHNLDKREFKNKKNGGMKMTDEINFEGMLESVDERTSDKTQVKYAIIKFKEAEQSFSIFDTKMIEKLRGKEGKKIAIKYWKSSDGKYNNVSEIFIEGERQTDAEIIKETYQEIWSICVKLKKHIDSMPKE